MYSSNLTDHQERQNRGWQYSAGAKQMTHCHGASHDRARDRWPSCATTRSGTMLHVCSVPVLTMISIPPLNRVCTQYCTCFPHIIVHAHLICSCGDDQPHRLPSTNQTLHAVARTHSRPSTSSVSISKAWLCRSATPEHNTTVSTVYPRHDARYPSEHD